MSKVELCCDTCQKPLRILTIADCLVVVSDWYCGKDHLCEDLCEKCYIEDPDANKHNFSCEPAMIGSHYYYHSIYSKDMDYHSKQNWNIEWLRGGETQAGDGVGSCRDEIY